MSPASNEGRGSFLGFSTATCYRAASAEIYPSVSEAVILLRKCILALGNGCEGLHHFSLVDMELPQKLDVEVTDVVAQALSSNRGGLAIPSSSWLRMFPTLDLVPVRRLKPFPIQSVPLCAGTRDCTSPSPFFLPTSAPLNPVSGSKRQPMCSAQLGIIEALACCAGVRTTKQRRTRGGPRPQKPSIRNHTGRTAEGNKSGSSSSDNPKARRKPLPALSVLRVPMAGNT
eukprot:CAMPEP_0177610754 /NCGR_PEP_ID=MMETSP0419_2-20121207/19990_1 /TAXON_ID=582737 /ORGANISM="Tetraselmis sp., Strain GSL018" /LENGTH=228 /DNA_ID=CAMNT_0019106165 /DNA_START=46 /DNA_END=730 /DNA_ORIENTATION=+